MSIHFTTNSGPTDVRARVEELFEPPEKTFTFDEVMERLSYDDFVQAIGSGYLHKVEIRGPRVQPVRVPERRARARGRRGLRR